VAELLIAVERTDFALDVPLVPVNLQEALGELDGLARSFACSTA
jgi:hypothetical protein